MLQVESQVARKMSKRSIGQGPYVVKAGNGLIGPLDVPVKLEKCSKDHNIGDVESPPINISQATQVHKDHRAQSFGEDNSTSGLLAYSEPKIAGYALESLGIISMLHLAGQLAPPNKLNLVPGAALQMQRELQWLKVSRCKSSLRKVQIDDTYMP
ncbi:hypothetical protein C3L33_21389, partial [Rhododendron williamsianum]